MKTTILKLIVKYVNLKALVKDLVCEVADEALENVVQRTDTQLDNVAKAALWPPFEQEMAKLIEAKLDLGKLLGVDTNEA